MKYKLYCDGSTRGNGKENAIGGWAYVVVHEEGAIICQAAESEVGTTNQRMELTAALRGLKTIFPTLRIGDIVQVYTDSAYLHNCVTQRWYDNWQRNGWKNAKRQPVANADLWEELIPYFDAWGVEFYKVKGHAGDKWNEYVDTLAQAAAEKRKAEEIKADGNRNN